MLSSFSAQWFTAYYITLGSLLISYGIYLMVKKYQMADYLKEVASSYEEPPRAFRSVLKYLLLFTLPGLILSFFPFSWIELLFSIWSLIIIYTTGQILLQWNAVSKQILAMGGELHKKVRFAGINMISIGVVIFMLSYLLISNTF